MEKSTENEQSNENTWFVITTAAGKFVCRSAMSRTEIMAKIKDGELIGCEEVFDFACPMQAVPTPGGQVALTKAQFASRLDFTLSPCRVMFDPKGCTIYFVADLDPKDRRALENIIGEAVRASETALTERIKDQTGLVVAKKVPDFRLGGDGARRP